MLALTLKHPWSWAIAHAEKRIENREWDDRLCEVFGVPRLIGEKIAIHGGSAPQRPKGRKHWRELSEKNPWREFCEGLEAVQSMLDGDLPESAAQDLARRCPSGPLRPECFILPGIVAVGVLQGVTRASRDRWAAQGCLHLLLADVVTLPEPVACPGAQGFWTVPDVIAAEVQRQVAQVQVTRPAQYAHMDGAAWLG